MTRIFSILAISSFIPAMVTTSWPPCPSKVTVISAAAMVCEAPLSVTIKDPGVAPGVLVEREDRRGLGEPGLDLLPQDPAAALVEVPVRTRRLGLAPADVAASALRSALAVLRLGTDDQDRVTTAGRDLPRAVREHALHHVAADRGQCGLRTRRAQALAQGVGGVRVGPEAPRHPHGVEASKQPGTAGVLCRTARGLLHQREGLEERRFLFRTGGVGASLQDLAGPDQDRRARIDRHGSASLAAGRGAEAPDLPAHHASLRPPEPLSTGDFTEQEHP